MGGTLELRKWASMRMQTLYRTLAGMMRNQHALELLLRTQLPHISEDQLLALLATKFTCLAALQRYHVRRPRAALGASTCGATLRARPSPRAEMAWRWRGDGVEMAWRWRGDGADVRLR